jgi:DNA-binding CsgD family transcriptional regulator
MPQWLPQATRSRARPRRPTAITPRKRQILDLLRDGHTPAQFAQKLGIKKATVQSLLRRSYPHYLVKTRQQLIDLLKLETASTPATPEITARAG